MMRYNIRFKPMMLILVVMLFCTAIVAGQETSVTHTIVNYPMSVSAGQTFQVDVDYTANLGDFGYRGGIYLDVIGASDGRVSTSITAMMILALFSSMVLFSVSTQHVH